MGAMTEDNTVFVLQRAIRSFKIKVADSTIKEFLLAHPYYPTLKSVCDALKKWRIEHYPLRLEPSEIKELETPFIAHLNVSGGQLAFVEKIKDDHVSYIVYKEKNRTESFEVFAGKLSGAVVILEKGLNSGEKGYRQKQQSGILTKALLPFGITAVLLLFLSNLFPYSGGLIFQPGIMGKALLITKLAGITSCIFLIMKEFEIKTSLTERICSFTSKTDCDVILSSSASKIFGWIDWADAGLIYFTGTLLFLSGARENTSMGILASISVLSLPYPAFSIYYQWMKLKKWCPFCLAVQFVLIAEFVFLSPALKAIIFTGTDMLRLTISFFVPAVIWLVFKAYYNKSEELEQEHRSYLRIKRDPAIFRFLLTQNKHTEFPETGTALVLGNSDAPIMLTAFLSLYCNPCAKAFKQLKPVIENCQEVKVNVIFSVHHDEETLKLINVLYYLYQSKGNQACLEFLDKWYSAPKAFRKTFYNTAILPEDFNIATQAETENKQLFETYHIEGTPAIYVNGYKFPNQFAYTDLEYFVDDLKQITMESKRQEAHIN